MKGRGLDHLEGREANQRSQILASDGAQGRGTRAWPACESGHSVIRLTLSRLTYLGSSIPRTLACRKTGLAHKSVVSSTHVFRPLRLPSSCAGRVVRIHRPVLAHSPRFSTGLMGKAGASAHMHVTCIVERGSALPGRTERGNPAGIRQLLFMAHETQCPPQTLTPSPRSAQRNPMGNQIDTP